MDTFKVESAVRLLLGSLGIDIKDENFIETPARVAKLYKEVLQGLYIREEEIECIFKAVYNQEYDEMLTIRDIVVYSLCPHHLLPVRLSVSFGYIPSGRVLGLSKIVKVIEILARRPVLQEKLVTDIVGVFEKYLKPRGCMAVAFAEHLCMQMRGVEKRESRVVASALRGIFKEACVKQEFLSFVYGEK